MATIIQLIFVSPMRTQVVPERNHVSPARKSSTALLADFLGDNELFVVVQHERRW